MVEVLLLIGAAVLVVACGVFVAAEFALIAVDRASVERLAEDGDRGAAGILAALRSLSTQLSGAQIGITLTNLAVGYLAEPAIAELIDGPLGAIGMPERAADGVSIVIALVLATAGTMIFGELVPKNLAVADPIGTARAVQRPVRLFTTFARPVIRLLNGMANGVLHRFGIEPQEELASARSAEELSSLVRRSAQEGTLERGTATLLQRSLSMGDRQADEVMTPRVRMRSLDDEARVSEVIDAARESGFSRFPVTREPDDAVVGIVHIKDAIRVPHERRAEVSIREVMRPPVAVPATLELEPLLEVLREGGLQMAVVVDEFGNVDGVVTFEDVVEEIVGDVVDEHDHPDAGSPERTADGAWLLSGLLRPDEAGRILELAVPEGEDYGTLGGLISVHLASMPEAGDHVELESVDLERRPVLIHFTVERMDGMRVDRVRITHEEIEVEEDEDDERDARREEREGLRRDEREERRRERDERRDRDDADADAGAGAGPDADAGSGHGRDGER